MPKTLAGKWRSGDEIEVYFDPRHPWLAEVDVYGLRNRESS
jgi:hypothetical protein